MGSNIKVTPLYGVHGVLYFRVPPSQYTRADNALTHGEEILYLPHGVGRL